MTDDIPLCPYCNRNTRITSRHVGTLWVNEGMDGPYHYVSKKVYKHQVICNKCFMRGPLMTTKEDAISAFRKLL